MKIKVLAIKKGFYGGEIRHENDVFYINKVKDFSDQWMQKVPDLKPENGDDGEGEE